jgi:hypothetical protein
MDIHSIINEIRNLQRTPTHKAALDIFRLLDNNSDRLQQKIDPDNFRMILKAFEALSEARPGELNTPSYKREYEQKYELLLFYLDRIL